MNCRNDGQNKEEWTAKRDYGGSLPHVPQMMDQVLICLVCL